MSLVVLLVYFYSLVLLFLQNWVRIVKKALQSSMKNCSSVRLVRAPKPRIAYVMLKAISGHLGHIICSKYSMFAVIINVS